MQCGERLCCRFVRMVGDKAPAEAGAGITQKFTLRVVELAVVFSIALRPTGSENCAGNRIAKLCASGKRKALLSRISNDNQMRTDATLGNAVELRIQHIDRLQKITNQHQLIKTLNLLQIGFCR